MQVIGCTPGRLGSRPLLQASTRACRPLPHPASLTPINTPSLFYLWLAEQTERTDAVGALARHAVADTSWPRAEYEKTPLRTYVRGLQQPTLVPALAEALAEHKELTDEALESWQTLWEENPSTGYVAEPLLLAWCELGYPDGKTVQQLASQGNADALALSGVYTLFGLNAPLNPSRAVQLLTAAFDAGCVSAAAVLDRYYGLLEAWDDSNRWLIAGARAGHTACTCQLFSRVIIAAKADDAFPMPEIEFSEVERLAAEQVGATGRVEWTVGRNLRSGGEYEAALETFARAAAQGWGPAYADRGFLLQQMEQMEEATEAFQAGAEAGDVICRGMVAMARYAEHEGSEIPSEPEERLRNLAEMEEAARHGCLDVFIPLALERSDRTFSAYDPQLALIYLSIAGYAATTEDDARLLEGIAATIWENDESLAANPSDPIDWLYTTAKETRTEDISLLANDEWLSGNFELPPDSKLRRK